MSGKSRLLNPLGEVQCRFNLSYKLVLTCWHELQDSVCGSTDLKASWEREILPVLLLTFLPALFKVRKHKLFRIKVQYLGGFLQHLENEED